MQIRPCTLTSSPLLLLWDTVVNVYYVLVSSKFDVSLTLSAAWYRFTIVVEYQYTPK